jgi:hypothetical protein
MTNNCDMSKRIFLITNHYENCVLNHKTNKLIKTRSTQTTQFMIHYEGIENCLTKAYK